MPVCASEVGWDAEDMLLCVFTDAGVNETGAYHHAEAWDLNALTDHQTPDTRVSHHQKGHRLAGRRSQAALSRIWFPWVQSPASRTFPWSVWLRCIKDLNSRCNNHHGIWEEFALIGGGA